MASGWGGISDIINEGLERKRQEEEAKREAMARALQERQQGPRPAPTPQPNPWQSPVFSAPSPVQAAPSPLPGPYENPYAVDTGPSQFSRSQNNSDTAQSRLPQQPMQSVSTVAPRPMLQSLSDRLRDPYNAPQQQPNPWQAPVFGGRGQAQQQPPGVTREDILAAQPEPIENRIGQSFQQGWNQFASQFQGQPQQNNALQLTPPVSMSDRLRDPYNAPNRPIVPTDAQGPAAQPYEQQPNGWQAFSQLYASTPEYLQAQQKAANRRAYVPPTLDEGVQQGVENASPTLFGMAAGAIGGAIEAGLNNFAPTRTGLVGLGDIGEFAVDVPVRSLINAPILGGYSASELITPIGKQYSEIINPYSVDWSWQKAIATVAGAIATRGKSLSPGYQGDLDQSQAARKLVADAVAKTGDPSLNIALRPIGGGDPLPRVQKVLDFAQNKEQKVAELQKQGAAAQESGDSVAAGEYFRQAQELQNMSLGEMVDSQLDPWSEIGYGMADPLDVLVSPFIAALSILPEARALARAAKNLPANEAEAIARLTRAGEQGVDLARSATEGGKAATKTYEKIIAPFQSPLEKFDTNAYTRWLLRNPPPAAKASLDSNVLSEGVLGVFNGIADKSDYRKIIPILADSPQDLIKGVAGLSEDAMTRLAQPDGMVRWGNSIANRDTVRRVPLLATVKEELLNMRSLKGTGKVNANEFQAELKTILFDASKRASGGRVAKLPFGATSVGVERTAADAAQVVYKDAKGNVIRRSTETTLTGAQRQLADIQKSVNPGLRKRDIPLKIAQTIANVQRYIMNDVWLIARPANAMGNATSATVSLYAHDAYTNIPLTDIHDWNSTIFGGYQSSARVLNTVPGINDLVKTAKDEVGGSAIGQVAAFVTRNPKNPVTQGMKALEEIPYGSTGIRIGNFEIPVGEENLAARANYVPAKRAYEAGLSSSARKSLLPSLQNIEGLESTQVEQIAKSIVNHAETKGKSGLLNAVRADVGKLVVKMNLAELGVPKELMSIRGMRDIERLLSDATPSQAGEVAQEITRIFHNEKMRAASSLTLDPLPPGFNDWTDADLATEAGWLANTFSEDAAKAGINVDEAKAAASEMATGFLQEQRATFESVAQDLAPAATNPAAWDVITDFYLDYMKAKNEAREVVNEAGRMARELNTPDAWTKKWQITNQTYTDLRQKLPGIAEQARLSLNDVLNGVAYEPRNDWWKTIENYMQWDEEAFQASRTVNLGGVEEDAKIWDEVIKRNRDMLDNAQYETFNAYQMYPTVESFDIVRNSIQRIETMGAQTAHEMFEYRKLRATGELSATKYNAIRNAKWNKFFDDSAELNHILGKIIVRNGIASETASGLKWTEQGTTFELLGPSSIAKKWKARNTSTDKIEEFTVAQTADELTPFTVPKSVVDDYNRLMGNEVAIDKATAAVMQEISDSAPEVIRPGGWEKSAEISHRQTGENLLVPSQGEMRPNETEVRPNETKWSHLAVDDVRPLPDNPEVPGYVAPEPVLQTPVTSVGDIAKLDAQGATEARKEMAAAWDREASAALGLPKLDQIVATYNRGGSVNLNLNKGEVKQFEDLYGKTVLGTPIENSDDVQRFVQQYVDPKKQAEQAKGAVAKSKQFAKMSVPEILRETRDELIAAGYSDAELRELAKDRRGLLDTVATIRGEDADFGMVAYDFAAPSISHVLGLEDKSDGYNVWKRMLETGKRTGGQGAANMADVAQVTIQNLNDAERAIKARLPEILAGTPNNLTGAQKLGIIDAATKWLPEVDNATSQARQVGRAMADFIMLNVEDKKDFDTLLSLFMPYSYFWRKMPSRIVSAALAKPSLVNKFYEFSRAIDLENDQSGVPDRLRGTLPIPGTDKRINVRGPLFKYAMGGAEQYINANPFVEDDPTDNAAEKVAKDISKFTPGFFNSVNVVLDLLDGKLDKDYSSVLNGLVPVPGPLVGGAPVSSLYQNATGNMPAGGNWKNMGFGPDEWDPYRAQRAIEWIANDEGIDQTLLGYANQVVKNQSEGKEISNNIDPTMLNQAIELAQRGVKQAAQDRIISRMSAYNTMFSVSPWTEAEKQAALGREAYYASGYDPNTNPYGSKATQKGVLEGNPAIANSWVKSSDTPGVDAQLNNLYAQKSRLSEQQTKAEEDAVRALNMATATSGDIYDARAAAREPFQKKKDAIDAQIDKLKAQQTPYQSNPTKGMNPQEVSESFANSVMWQAREIPGKPAYPGDDATSQQWDAYNKARVEYDKAQESFIVNALTQVPTSDVVRERRGPVKYTKNQAIELWWNFNHDRELPEERARLEQLDRESASYNAANTAQMQSAKQRVKNGDRLLQEYLDTPKDGDERNALKEKDWRYAAILIAAYDPAVYDAAVKAVGQDGLQQYFEARGEKPEWPGENATEAEMQVYYKAKNEYDAKYPLREEASLWLNGRYTYSDDISSSNAGNYDKGADYAKAIETFTPRIFEIERAFNEASLNGNFVAYRNAHPADYALSVGYGEWKKAGQELPQSMDNLPTARWGVNPATQNASYATDADRSAFPGKLPYNQTQSYWDDQFANDPQVLARQGSGNFQPKTPTRGSTQLAGVNPPASETPRTAQQWANQNAKYVEGVRIGAEIQARRNDVGAAWGDEALAQWDAFFALPKDSAARQAYKDANPVVRAMLLTAYNPTQYQQALADGFSNEDILAWAGRPPYEGDGSARAGYWDSNPSGWRFNAYLNGRPQAYDPKSDNEDFTYNWGADYNQAKELFGANIWDVVLMQRSLPDDKVARAQFYEANPQYSAWADWWYSNLPDNGYVSAASSYGSGYGRSYGGWGGGGGGGGGYVPTSYPAQVNPRYMDRTLWDSPGQRQPWIPYSRPNPDWLQSGRDLQPRPINKWIPPRF